MTALRCPVLVGLLVLAVSAAACDGATTTGTGTPGATPAAESSGPTAVPNPGAPDKSAGPGGGTGGGSAPGSGSGVLDPGGFGGPGPGGLDPNREPTIVMPVPNARDVHDVAVTTLEASTDGRRVAVRMTWTSGAEPCTVLAGVDVVRGDHEITLTVREGSGAGPDVLCTAQAIRKTTIVDLGDLEPGAWTIRAFGDAPAVEVVVPD